MQSIKQPDIMNKINRTMMTNNFENKNINHSVKLSFNIPLGKNCDNEMTKTVKICFSSCFHAQSFCKQKQKVAIWDLTR